MTLGIATPLNRGAEKILRRRCIPITESVDRAARIVRFVAEGELVTDELLAGIDRAVAAAGNETGWKVLSDHRGMDVPGTGDQVRAMLEHIRLHGRAFYGSRWAVVTNAPASFGMTRVLATLAESVPISVRIFADIPEALQWLQETP